MALSASTVLEVRQTGSDTNGGGYVSGGTDWSQQDAAQYSVTDAVTNGTTTITSATAAFGTDVVGNLAYVQGGTGAVTAGWYQVISRTNATTIVVDRSTGLTAGTGVTLKIGGALATPGLAASLITVSGQMAWVKYNATPYNLTTATPGAGGPVLFAASIVCKMEGYETTRGDRTANQPTLSWASVAAPGSNTYLFSVQGFSREVFANLIADANNVNNVSCFNLNSQQQLAITCIAKNASGTNGIGFTQGYTEQCKASNCVTGFSGQTFARSCRAASCTTGYVGGGAMAKCIADGCTTGYSLTATGTYCADCVADGCTTGFSDGNRTTFAACLATNCSGGSAKGFLVGGSTYLASCAVYNNTTHVSGTPFVNVGQITLTADPYQNLAGGDFRPNTTAGGGAALRNAGFGVHGQTDNADVGAVQHTDPAGGGTTTYVINQIRNMFLFNETEP